MSSAEGGQQDRPGDEQGPGYAPAPPPAPTYGGYAPAPSAQPGWGAPAPVERPVTVRAGLGAYIAYLILGLVGSIYVFSDFDSLVNRALAQAGQSGTTVTAQDLRPFLIAGAVIGLVIVAVEALFIWFAWQGRNWARIVLWVIGGLGIVSGLTGLATNSQYGGFYAAIGVFQLLLALAGVVLLALKPSGEWFRYRRWLRATGQGR